jgi:hypothetical protein
MDTPTLSLPTVEAGMRRVLEAESAARASIMSCEQEAARAIAQARARARRIAQRADGRISAIRIHCTRRIARELAELRARTERRDDALGPDAAGQARIAQAVAQLAARLTGAESEDAQ